MKNINPTSTTAWQELLDHYKTAKSLNLKEAFQNNKNRAEELTLTDGDFHVDLSKNLITKETQGKLVDLANECRLSDAIDSYFGGEKINATENRAVLHTALRTNNTDSPVAGNISAAIASKEKMFAFVDAVNNGTITAANGQKFNTVVNIGIGGSDLGPVMIYEAMQAYKNDLTLHFVSNVEGDHVEEVLKKINPETTLFVIVSKSFGTQETLTNSTTIRNWFKEKVNPEAVAQHFIAVSSNIQRAVDFGIQEENIFPMFDWVGGRFSLWSTVGMSVALSIGSKNFQGFLDGAQEMDTHFKNSSFDKNIPVQLALLTIWYNNFYKAQSEAVIPYTQYLHRLPAYLQQAIMESNGKSVDRNGDRVTYETGNVVWGEPGTNSQHAFFQLIHQGTKLIPAQFIAFAKAKYNQPDHHNKLMANFFAQTEALMNGKTKEEALKDHKDSGKTVSEIEHLVPFQVFEGNKPTTTILIDELTPQSLGKLVAMYEHKIFTEGVIWNIYSYDQWGVQLGKVLADAILTDIESSKSDGHDSSTNALLKRFYSRNK
ncbi:glucose-6-phosphate isomerase [Nonlabens xylanidelens]|uniref:Glucose-6-phosphate isomerase n=1 Tax=Nonlabens xylanidelens TaxID=191564 RepID=A0A2S6IRV5_9FLAO|nr:glucose-6-phosphate isomerase [Nonlabens xylanidelens]PPK97003.1 glucose-6-phosphate isomerase [Nonlabens xylanidelens]PQJ13694.1 glucose-6-phosphate isomerase [Nonlabens xylanidelens]